jgi:hypothetical protein
MYRRPPCNTVRHRKYFISALTKTWIFTVPYIRCWSSGFLCRGPISIPGMSLWGLMGFVVDKGTLRQDFLPGDLSLPSLVRPPTVYVHVSSSTIQTRYWERRLRNHTHTENSRCSDYPNKRIFLELPRAMIPCHTCHFWNFSERRIRAAQKTVSCFPRILERDWFCISLSYTREYYFSCTQYTAS